MLKILVDCTFTFHRHAVLELHCEREVVGDRLVVSGCTTNRPAVILCSFEQQPPAECKTHANTIQDARKSIHIAYHDRQAKISKEQSIPVFSH